ncbi:MAG: hypothetical protein JO079_02025, partial [Frankiaceae bacterium]|nr:hypothetical protein [Frankiaceae bacterium]
MRHRRTSAALASVAIALGSATAFAIEGPGPVPSTGATPKLVAENVRISAYPVYDASGRKVGTAKWRISPAGGNCCETYVAATPTGRIVEAGGTYPWYTDDQGKHWYEVKFDVPDQNDNGQTVAGGEGAAVVGPGGNIYGVTWDAYSGDHLQAYRYTAQTRTWAVSEVVMKTPFYDRPWITYAKGPFVLNGAKTDQILDSTGGGITKAVDTLSPDGQDYSTPSDSGNDESNSTAVNFKIPVVRNPAADWWQPHPGTSTIPLNAGGVLRMGGSACNIARLDPATSKWQCVKLTGQLQGVVRQDSRGYLTEVYPTAGDTALTLATSRDGGVTWSSTTLSPPPGTGMKLETPDLFNVIANGALKQAVVTARWDDSAKHGHDLVFRVDTSKAAPKLMRTYAVGKGDLDTGNDVTSVTQGRFDYETIALLPDGKIAVTFDDSSC